MKYIVIVSTVVCLIVSVIFRIKFYRSKKYNDRLWSARFLQMTGFLMLFGIIFVDNWIRVLLSGVIMILLGESDKYPINSNE